MSVDWNKLPGPIQCDLTERGVTPKRVAEMSPTQVLDEFLIWNGIIGWAGTLYGVVHSIDDAAK